MHGQFRDREPKAEVFVFGLPCRYARLPNSIGTVRQTLALVENRHPSLIIVSTECDDHRRANYWQRGFNCIAYCILKGKAQQSLVALNNYRFRAGGAHYAIRVTHLTYLLHDQIG
ncbi:hypothetical protein ASE12_04330 [Aeromicrobium sp. Root236]|nr:hypothetical protein ASE12_04330 [Aeromicrobium sp. Root236]